MPISVQIDIRDHATPRLNQFLSALQRRRGLNSLVGQRAQNLIRDHLIKLANTRHATASRLGARPSGFLTKAAEKVARADSVKPSEEDVRISLNHPGLVRAFKDVEIKAETPGVKFLTIPLVAEAYNKRARRIEGLFMRGRTLSKKGADGSVTAYYALVPRVVQRQDRSLLPADAEITNAALKGVADYVQLLKQAGGPAAT